MARVARILWIVFVLCLLEGSTRVYWRFQGLPWTATVRSVYQTYYPELESIRPASPGRGRVLLLGGSVLKNLRGEIGRALASRGRYYVHPTAKSAHTTRDSLIKYRLLDAESFDLVIFYHGINDVRANNIAPENFRADYSHYFWYEALNTLERYRPYPYLLTPASAHLAWVP